MGPLKNRPKKRRLGSVFLRNNCKLKPDLARRRFQKISREVSQLWGQRPNISDRGLGLQNRSVVFGQGSSKTRNRYKIGLGCRQNPISRRMQRRKKVKPSTIFLIVNFSLAFSSKYTLFPTSLFFLSIKRSHNVG